MRFAAKLRWCSMRLLVNSQSDPASATLTVMQNYQK
jgi:hypothetical protein